MTHLRAFLTSLTVALAISPCLAQENATAAPRFQLTEYLGETWTQELVTFPMTLPDAFPPDRLAVRSEEGDLLPAQFAPETPGQRQGRVCFVVDLPPNARQTWTLVPQATAPKTDLLLREDDATASLEFGASKLAVRCPWGQTEWPGGIPAAEAPAPVQAVRLSEGTWGCSAQMHSPRRLLSLTTEVLHSGPVVAEVRLRYSFEGDKTYTVQLRALAGQEVLTVTERSDLDEGAGFSRRPRAEGSPEGNFFYATYDQDLVERGSYWTMRFDAGLEPDRMAWQPRHQVWSSLDKPGTPHGNSCGYVVGGRADGNTAEPGEPRWTFALPPVPGPLVTLNPTHGEWILNVSNWAGVYSSRPAANFLALMALHASAWDNPHENLIVFENDAQSQLQAVLPINTGSRVWGLYAGPRDDSIAYPADWPEERDIPPRRRENDSPSSTTPGPHS